MPGALTLESFEEAATETDQPNAEYARGYEEGFAAATAAAQADTAALTADLVQAISDITFSYAEARGEILQSLLPLFAVLTERVLPHCVATGFAGQLATLLQEAATADANAPITLHVHPNQQDAVAAALSHLAPQVRVGADPALSANAAWINQNGGETLLDADTLLAEITTALTAIQYHDERTSQHG